MGIKRRFAFFASASIWRASLGILILPLTTLKLDIADFGLFALMMAIAGVSTGLSGVGSNQLLSAHLTVLTKARARDLTSTIFIFSLTIASVVAGFIALGWRFLSYILPDIADTPESVPILVAALVCLWTPWSIASSIAAIEGRARAFAAIVAAEATTNAFVVIFSLYVMNLGFLSLIIGATAGAAVNAIGSMLMIRNFLTWRITGDWFLTCAKVGFLSAGTGALERVLVALERFALSAYAGLSTVGIYSHGQLYQGLARMGMKSWANALWPVALSEARDLASDFPNTSRAYTLGQVLLGVAAVGMATVGRDIISLMTHGKFTPAYLPATFLLIVVQMEYMARAAMAVLYANARYLLLQRSLIVSQLFAAAAIFPAVGAFGIYGAIGTTITQAVLYRSLILHSARTIRPLPFQDLAAVVGIVATLTALVLVEMFATELFERALTFCAIAGALVLIYLATWMRRRASIDVKH